MNEHDNIEPQSTQNMIARRHPDELARPNQPRRGPPVRHGLARRSLCIAPQDREAFRSFRAVTLHEFDPQSQAESFYAEEIIVHRWLLLHADIAEAASMRMTFTGEMRRKLAGPDSYFRGEPRTEEERLDCALAKTASTKEVHSILKYRVAHERALERLERMLCFAKKQRQADAAQPIKSPDDCRRSSPTALDLKPGAKDRESTD